jgi:hypothetical protein
MTKDQYWKSHVKKNPRLENEDDNVTLKVSTLRKLMEEAFDKGSDYQRELSKSIRDMMNNLGGPFGGV